MSTNQWNDSAKCSAFNLMCGKIIQNVGSRSSGCSALDFPADDVDITALL